MLTYKECNKPKGRGYLYNICLLFGVEMLIYPDFNFQNTVNLEYSRFYHQLNNCSYRKCSYTNCSYKNVLIKISYKMFF